MSSQLWSSASPVAFNLECNRHTQWFKIETNKYISSKKKLHTVKKNILWKTLQLTMQLFRFEPTSDHWCQFVKTVHPKRLFCNPILWKILLLMMHYIYTDSKAIRAWPQSALHSRKSKPLNININEKHQLQDSNVQL